MTKVLPGRAAGGYLVHLVNAKTGVALCGHKPKNTGRLFKRARWLKVCGEYDHRWCMKCRNRIGEEVTIDYAVG